MNNILPSNVLSQQKCHECQQYLSVGPVVINRCGQSVCGRCCNTSDTRPYYTKSLFNVLASGFLFKCKNHYNGCTAIVPFKEMEDHESVCDNSGWLECFFCSFSGEISQVFPHALDFHAEKITYDGIVLFGLDDSALKKTFLFILDDKAFILTLKSTLDDIIVNVRLVTKTTTVNQFAVKFYNPIDPLNAEFVHTDYSLLNKNFESHFKKSKAFLTNIFGAKVQLCCQIVVDSLNIQEEEVNLIKRYERLRLVEEDSQILKRNLELRERNLLFRSDTFDAAIDVIKLISCNLFKCSTCLKTNPELVFFCPSMHACCKECLSLNDMCKQCNAPKMFKRLNNIENFLVSCDWPGCTQKIKLKDNFDHKAECSFRQYKCPLPDCNVMVLSAEKLIEHWHVETPRIIKDDSFIMEEYKCEELFWLLENDLCRVSVQFDANFVKVLIEEISVLPYHEFKFKCEGFVPNCYQDICWHNLNSTHFCGKFEIHMPNTMSVRNVENGAVNQKITKIKIFL